MGKQPENRNVDFTNSSVRNTRENNTASEDALEHLDGATGGAEQPLAYGGELSRETAKQKASTEEEVDALRVNLTQDDDSRHNTRYGTGVVADDLAQDQIAGATEVGPMLDDKGVNSLVPGRDNTSSVLRRHHPNTENARAQNVVEGNLEEPRDEGRMDRKVDEGTAA